MRPSHVRQLLSTLNIRHPIIQAPMAGFTPPKLVIAVTNAGGLGSLGAALLSPEQIEKSIQEIRASTKAPFAVNLFAPTQAPKPTDSQIKMMNALLDNYRKELGLPLSPTVSFTSPNFEKQLEVVMDERPPVFSFTFNLLPSDTIKKLKQLGIRVMGTATSLSEGKALAESGIDFIVAQGYEAGGHRGTWPNHSIEASLVGLISLVTQLKKEINIPIIASGGIMTGNGILSTLMLGASAVQMGTAFLTTAEASTPLPHREALLRVRETHTVLTRAFTGRYARAISNRFTKEMKSHETTCLPFPYQSKLTADIKTKAAEKNDADFMSLWAGQGANLCRTASAQELISLLISEAISTLEDWG